MPLKFQFSHHRSLMTAANPHSKLNPLTPRVKQNVIQSFITFDSMDRTLKCDHSLKAVEQYFTVVLFVNPLTRWVKPCVMQSFLTFDSMDRTLKCDHSLKAVEQYFTVVLFVNPLTRWVKPCVMQSFLTFWFYGQNPKVWPFIESCWAVCFSILLSLEFWLHLSGVQGLTTNLYWMSFILHWVWKEKFVVRDLRLQILLVCMHFQKHNSYQMIGGTSKELNSTCWEQCSNKLC